MAKRKEATSDIRLLRIFEIHKCLRDNKTYKTEDLLGKVLKIDTNANERIIKADIEFLRNLGAKIPKGNKHHGFYYEHPFSLLEAIEGKKMSELDDLLAFIQQKIDKTPAYLGLDNVLLALEQRVRTSDARRNPFLEFEKVESEGLKRLDEFYRYIKSKRLYEIDYTPFGEEMQSRLILPLFLKEYNHRWTLIAFDKHKNALQNFPLERIGKRTKISNETLQTENAEFDAEKYFKDVIGVTKYEEVECESIIFKLAKKRAFYVDTKKIHPTQIKTEEDETSMTFQIKVKPNNEMWAKFMELAEDLTILSPDIISNRFYEKIEKCYNRLSQKKTTKI